MTVSRTLLGLKPAEWWAQTLDGHNLGNAVATDTTVLEDDTAAD
jgi:hypothetical protein